MSKPLRLKALQSPDSDLSTPAPFIGGFFIGFKDWIMKLINLLREKLLPLFLSTVLIALVVKSQYIESQELDLLNVGIAWVVLSVMFSFLIYLIKFFAKVVYQETPETITLIPLIFIVFLFLYNSITGQHLFDFVNREADILFATEYQGNIFQDIFYIQGTFAVIILLPLVYKKLLKDLQ